MNKSCLEYKIDKNVEYWSEEWEEGDYNVFKMELYDDDDELQIDVDEDINWGNIDSIVCDAWVSGNYLYIELDKVELQRRYEKRWSGWNKDKEQERMDYYRTRF